MPTYDYRCSQGHVFERLVKIADREHAQCDCGESADLVILRGPIIDPKMGVSGDFPSLAAKWTKKQWKKSLGKMHDANQNSYGTMVDHDAVAHGIRKDLGV